MVELGFGVYSWLAAAFSAVIAAFSPRIQHVDTSFAPQEWCLYIFGEVMCSGGE